MRAVLVGLLTLFSMVSSVCGAEVRTYRIAQTDVPSFRFGGGLLDFDFAAHLQGTLEVTITDEATASVSRFDLTLHNLANTGTYDLGWAEGDRLGEHLHFDPLSLAGEHTHDVVDRLVLSAVHPTLSYAVLSSALSIDHTSDSLAVLRLTSTYLEANPASELPRPVLDVPNMRIETSPKVGLLVRLVPEPSGVTIAASFLVVGLVRRTRRIC